MAKTTYSISDLAAEFDITTRTIRFYEEKGLLAPTRSGINRIYTATDRTKLKLILRGKRLGFTLEESRDLISMYDPAGGNVAQLKKLQAGIRQKRAQLALQLNDLEAMMIDLQDADDNCQQAMASASGEKAETGRH